MRTAAADDHDEDVHGGDVAPRARIDGELADVLRVVRREVGERLLEVEGDDDAAVVGDAGGGGEALARGQVFCIVCGYKDVCWGFVEIPVVWGAYLSLDLSGCSLYRCMWPRTGIRQVGPPEGRWILGGRERPRRPRAYGKDLNQFF